MGLDVVELVIRCEEEFGIRLEDWKLERAGTVGDLFELICEQLRLPFVAPPGPMPGQTVPEISDVITSPDGKWTRSSVWARLVRVCVDQLQVDEPEVRYHAHFSLDLGAD